MVLIIIRHGDDENGRCSKKNDCSLVKDGIRLASRVGKELITKYGVPDKIYVSPFKRTLQTLDAMVRDTDDIEVIEDKGLCRYFTEREKRDPKIHKETMRKNIPIDESYTQFRNRVSRCISFITENTGKDEVVWVITHTLVYKRFGRHFGVDLPSRIPFMHNFRGSYCDRCEVYH